MKSRVGKTVCENKYAVYVLVVFMVVYVINQCDTFCLIATNPSMAQEIEYGERECDVREDNVTDLEEYLSLIGDNSTASDYCLDNADKLCSEQVDSEEDWCYWHYLGRGTQYQLLAGPMYIVLFAISGIPLGLASELKNLNRKVFLFVCILMWSIMTSLGGFATEYWHLAITRLLLGVFSAGCVPFCTSLLGDYFPTTQRGAALGFFNWGVFVGYSLSFVLIIAEEELGWRAVYFIAGVPGILISILVLLTVKDPGKSEDEMSEKGKDKALSQLSGMFDRLKMAASHFADPVLLMLCFAGAIRNGAGLVWAYNIVLFFDEYHPEVNVEAWMSWIPLIFGSAGAFGGGYISDKLSANKGVKGRLIILICCCFITAPFQIGTLYLPPNWCWVSHMVAYLFGEAWLGVCAAIVIDLVPADLTASAIAVYFFIIQIIGGNMNLFVTPITNSLDMRTALLITFPGLYIVGGALFSLTLFIYIKREGSQYELEGEDENDIKEIDMDENIVVKSTEPLALETKKSVETKAL